MSFSYAGSATIAVMYRMIRRARRLYILDVDVIALLATASDAAIQRRAEAALSRAGFKRLLKATRHDATCFTAAWPRALFT